MKYDLKKPCENCPFLREGGVRLRKARLREICRAVLGNPGAEFACHKTTRDDDDEDGGRSAGPESSHCAGAIILALKSGQCSQMLRIAERLRLIDCEKMLSTPEADLVVGSEDELLEVNGFPGEGERETCHVANDDCLLPANYNDFDIDPDDVKLYECHPCGQPVCSECSKNKRGKRICAECEESERFHKEKRK